MRANQPDAILIADSNLKTNSLTRRQQNAWRQLVINLGSGPINVQFKKEVI